MTFLRRGGVGVVGLLMLALGCAGCGDSGDVDRDSYVAQNQALLQTIPSFPGAKQRGKVESSGYKLADRADAPTAGYSTSRTDRLPPRTSRSRVLAYYRRKLRPDWRPDRSLPGGAGSFWMNLRNGDAHLYVEVGGGVVDLSVDHDCFKGGRTPRCGGP